MSNDIVLLFAWFPNLIYLMPRELIKVTSVMYLDTNKQCQ